MNDIVWKDVVGYKGLYFVSNTGEIKNKKNKILKPATQSTGYCYVWLCEEGIKELALVHRVVANAFLPNLTNARFVSHLNGDKKDNRVENLCWSNSRVRKTRKLSKTN